jgi:hypothetical protein
MLDGLGCTGSRLLSWIKSPLNHLRPPLPVTNVAIRSPDTESSISPSISTLPTLSLGTARPAPGATVTEAAVAPAFKAVFFLPPVGSTLVIAMRTSKGSPLVPPITILVPTHNEERSICRAMRNLLDLDYSELEVIVINDGSADRTLELIQDEFCLRRLRVVYVPSAVSARVRDLYRSGVDPRLLVVDKESGGSKADAVNAGLNAATSPYVCLWTRTRSHGSGAEIRRNTVAIDSRQGPSRE